MVIIKKSGISFDAKIMSMVLGSYPIPEDYQQFMQDMNGGKPELNLITAKDYGQITIGYIFSVNSPDKNKDLVSNIIAYQGRVPQGKIPIADVEGGNLLLLCFSGNDFGKVYFWDHESEDRGVTYFVSDSFKELLEKMEKFNPDKIELKPGSVTNIWIDPELLK